MGEKLGDKGGKGLGKADTPSNTGTHTGRQWDTRRDTGVGRRTHHPKGDRWRQGETRPQEGGHTIQQRKTRRGTMGNKGDKTIEKADSPSNRGKPEWVQWETKGDKTLGKADTPSNNWQQEGAQWETKGDKTLAKADTPSNKGQQERPTMGDKGRQDPREGKHTIHQKETRRHKGRQWETRLVSHCTPSFSPLLDGVSAFPKVLSPVRLPEGLVSPCLPLYPFSFPFVGWCVRLPEGLVSLCLPLCPFLFPFVGLYPFLFPFVGWCARLPEGFVFHCTPSCFPLLDGVSPSRGSCLPLSPSVPRLVSLCLCWMARAPSRGICLPL